MPSQDYELLEVIGEGTSGEVYRGYHCSLKKDVAIKKLHDGILANEHAARQVFDEAYFLANLVEVQNVVRLHEVIESEGLIVMELMRTSFDHVVARRALKPAQVSEVLCLALCGLRAMHDAGRLHGAIRPSSLLVDSKGKVVKLTASARITPGSKEIPVPHPRHVKYLSPELIDPSFGPIGPGIDLYALGFTGLELLAGPSFEDFFKASEVEAEAGWLRLHGSSSVPMPACKEIAPAAPDWLAGIIDRLLSREVSQRYTNAQQVLDDLAANRVTVPAPPPPTEPAPTPPDPLAPQRTVLGRLLLLDRNGQLLKRFPLYEGDNWVGKPEPEWDYVPEINLDSFDEKEVVSRKHALVRIEPDRVTLMDASLNGTWVDDARLKRKREVDITPRSRLRFANLFAQVELDNPSSFPSLSALEQMA